MNAPGSCPLAAHQWQRTALQAPEGAMLAAAKGVAAPRSPDAEHAALPPPPCSSRAQQRRGRHGDGEAGFQSRRQVVSALAASELDSTARGAWRPWHVWRGSTGDEQQGWAARQLAKCARTLLAAATACSAAGGGGARRPQQQLADRGKQGQAGAPNGAADCGGAFALEPPYGGEAGIPEGAAQPNVHQLGAAWGCAGGGSRSGAAGDMASVRVLQGGNCKRAAGRMCSAAGPGGLWRCLVRCAVSRRAWWAGRCKPASGAKAGEGGEQRVRLTGLRLAAEQAGQQREGRPTYHRLTLRCQRWGPCAFLTAPWYSKEGLQGPRGRSRRVGAAARRGRRTATAVGAAWWCRVPVRWVLGLRNCPIRQPWRRAWDHRTPAMPPMPRSGEAGRAAEGHAVLASWPKALGWQGSLRQCPPPALPPPCPAAQLESLPHHRAPDPAAAATATASDSDSTCLLLQRLREVGRARSAQQAGCGAAAAVD